MESYVILNLSAYLFQGIGVGSRAKLKALGQPLTRMLLEVNCQQDRFFGLPIP